jgi:hypothetical protein
LRGGRWRVLRWLAGDPEPPVLAAEGNLVAVGAQLSSAKMEVSILDVRNGRADARFDLPYGHLAFASRDRLVLSVTMVGRANPSSGSSTWHATNRPCRHPPLFTWNQASR